MTESNKRSDADAVLTSVRRIVTRQLSAEELGAPPPAKPETRPVETPEPERLLLTPALRVADPAEAEPLNPLAERFPSRSRTSLEERIAELELAVGSVVGEFEPDGSELVDEETPRRFFHNVSIDPVPERPDKNEAPIALDVPGEPADPAAPLPFPGVARQIENAPTPSADGLMDGDASEDADLDTDPVNLTEIDESILREIVGEIVRSELQGELGERITRNVRKLVRREIHRALMSRDFS